jgi:hypothetical protein
MEVLETGCSNRRCCTAWVSEGEIDLTEVMNEDLSSQMEVLED